MNRSLATLFILFALISAKAQSGKKLAILFKEIDEINVSYEVKSNPESYTFQRVEQMIEEANELEAKLQELQSFKTDKLSRQQQINLRIKLMQVSNQVSEVKFKRYLIPFNSEGGFYNSPSYFIPWFPFKGEEDYQTYLKWLPSYSDYIDYNIELLKSGIEEGIMAPKVIVERNIQLLEPWTDPALTGNPFLNPLVDTQYESEGIKIIRQDLLPSYQRLKAFLTEEYLPKAPYQIGISAQKVGKAYYENRIRHFTTLDISPDSVFATGQAEVKRIRGLMQNIIDGLAFEGDFAAFIQFLRTDEQFYPKTPAALLNRAAWLSKKAEGQLPRLFSQLYELSYTVEPVPDDIAPNYTAGRYVGGSRQENRPGIYWVNTYNLPSRSLYTLPALTLHEAVPGHHLQITLASELKDLPSFRRTYYISAFGEGWGLYSEYLGEEMGMYETPYELFGRYTYEMWRACRLVIDVGIHYKGWTRDQAVQFMSENTALSLHEVNTEIDRYIGWPGQAVSYKMGELMIKKLRKQCEDKLGDQFDIQAFHALILKNGSVPLPVLEEEINNYLR